MLDLYEQLKYDLGILDAGLTKVQAEQVIEFLNISGLLDYDALKEYYLDEEDG